MHYAGILVYYDMRLGLELHVLLLLWVEFEPKNMKIRDIKGCPEEYLTKPQQANTHVVAKSVFSEVNSVNYCM